MCSVRYYANLRLWSVISNESRSTKSGTTKKELNFYKFMITGYVYKNNYKDVVKYE